MAVLPDGERKAAADDLGREFSELGLPCGITKPELLAAAAAADAWVEANAAAFNAALPQPARGTLSNRQKALLLSRVAHRRAIQA
jgi:hypothetical protein